MVANPPCQIGAHGHNVFQGKNQGVKMFAELAGIARQATKKRSQPRAWARSPAEQAPTVASKRIEAQTIALTAKRTQCEGTSH